MARALASAVDGELQRSRSVLQVLATSPQLDEGNIDDFALRALRVQEAMAQWSAIMLADAGGKVLSHTGGAVDQRAIDRETLERVTSLLATSCAARISNIT